MIINYRVGLVNVFFWLRTGGRGGLFWTRRWTLEFQSRR